MKTLTKQPHTYRLDLSKTDRTGAFHCPNCNAEISPDDYTEETYTIYEIVATNNNLERLVLYCKRCQSFIQLTGFSNILQTAIPSKNANVTSALPLTPSLQVT
ncbi:MAG: hypothetical protein NWE92_12160 [Candidatus Bathyarchaeota archaeon]|nr:hypothetical protein [Candidatus Bathyarchaeota archaeon]